MDLKAEILFKVQSCSSLSSYTQVYALIYWKYLYSWILNRRKAALIFVHLLEQISIFIQIPFESSLIPSILYFYKAKVPLKVVHHGIFSVMNLMWPRCSVCHWHLIPLGMTELGQVLIVWFKHAAQSSPHCSLHICMPEIWWQSAFWSHEAPYQLWDGHVSNCVAGKEPWCSGERGKEQAAMTSPPTENLLHFHIWSFPEKEAVNIDGRNIMINPIQPKIRYFWHGFSWTTCCQA